MRVLITNDDGVSADGIFALQRALRDLHDVTVVAPERQQSASGHAITLHKPLRLTHVALRDGTPAYASNGTPSDCAVLGVQVAMDGKADLVISGINRGPNLGWDVHYSGTVSAAIEASVMGIPSFAISVASWNDDIDWSGAAHTAVRVADWLLRHPMPENTILNVNVPDSAIEDLMGLQITTQGSRQYIDRIERRKDPVGKPYYWLGGSVAGRAADAVLGTDVRAVADGYVSVTPLHLDMTAYTLTEHLNTLTI